MDPLDLNHPRTGGLMLCECGHLKAFHFSRPKWHGGPLTEDEPCSHCACAPNAFEGCREFKPGKFQGYDLRQGH